jgi:hypothetical protein
LGWQEYEIQAAGDALEPLGLDGNHRPRDTWISYGLEVSIVGSIAGVLQNT